MEQLTSVVGPVPARPAQSWSRPGFVVPALVIAALVAGAFPSFTYRANIAVLGVGGGLFWLGMVGRIPRRRAPRRLPAGAAAWLVPSILLGAIELVSFALGSTHEHPTLSKMADPWLTWYPGRATAYFGWLWAYWALVRR
jgi:hypothetical protein